MNTERRSIEKKTFSYKDIDGIEIKADLYRLKGGIDLNPAIIWIHGGGLVSGSREDVPEEQITYYLDNGYSIISIDYRIAPTTPLRQISNDIQDAITWTRKNGEDLLKIDKEKIYLVGHSAGAYLSILAGNTMEQAPKAIVSFYGYGDILDDWANAPDEYYMQMDRVTAEDALTSIDDSTITNASFKERYDFYVYTRQSGTWGKMVTNLNREDHLEELKSLCPARNIRQNFPPTFLIHGTKDTDVPFSQSLKLSQEFEKNNIEYQFIEMKGFGHMFDKFEGGLDNEEIKKTFVEVLKFLMKYE